MKIKKKDDKQGKVKMSSYLTTSPRCESPSGPLVSGLAMMMRTPGKICETVTQDRVKNNQLPWLHLPLCFLHEHGSKKKQKTFTQGYTLNSCVVSDETAQFNGRGDKKQKH